MTSLAGEPTASGEIEPYSLEEGEWQLSGHADIRKNMAIRAELAHLYGPAAVRK